MDQHHLLNRNILQSWHMDITRHCMASTLPDMRVSSLQGYQPTEAGHSHTPTQPLLHPILMGIITGALTSATSTTAAQLVMVGDFMKTQVGCDHFTHASASTL